MSSKPGLSLNLQIWNLIRNLQRTVCLLQDVSIPLRNSLELLSTRMRYILQLLEQLIYSNCVPVNFDITSHRKRCQQHKELALNSRLLPLALLTHLFNLIFESLVLISCRLSLLLEQFSQIFV